VQPALVHEARAARDVERHDDAGARLQLANVVADLLDDAHRLVAQDVALAHEWAEQLVQVQVRAADARRRDPHDHVRRLLDRRVRDAVDADISLAVPGQCLMALSSGVV
jgi:hypothetical protein